MLSRLKLAHRVGAKNLKVRNDSMLVTNQINSVYDTKNLRRKRYMTTLNTMMVYFDILKIEQVKRSENK